MINNSTRGKLIVFEGPDGGGKSTQVKLLAEMLNDFGKKVITLREPGGTIIGEKVRDILLDSKFIEMATKTELLLFMAARAQLVEEVIIPALNEGTFVICDRFIMSTIAYQGIAGGEKIEDIKNIATLATNSLNPDITIVIDVPTEVGMKRVGSKKDRMENKGFDFHHKIREGYLMLAQETNNVFIVDGTASIENLNEKIMEITKRELF